MGRRFVDGSVQTTECSEGASSSQGTSGGTDSRVVGETGTGSRVKYDDEYFRRLPELCRENRVKAGKGFWRESRYEDNHYYDSNGNRLYWIDEMGEDVCTDMLEPHPYIPSAYWSAEDAVCEPQTRFSSEPSMHEYGRSIREEYVLEAWLRLWDKIVSIRKLQRYFHTTGEMLKTLRLTQDFRHQLYHAFPYERLRDR
jgi:hypothetical protein